MKRIVMSLAAIAAVFALAVGATSAYFTSTASVTSNTFSTGVLEIRTNGQVTRTGQTYSPMAPGQIGTAQFDVNNYGAPWFAGPSNLAAKQLYFSAVNATGDSGLWSNLYIKVETNAGWTTRQLVYNGPISALSNADLLHPRWSELAPGNSITLFYEVWVPESGSDQNAIMGKTVNWDFTVEGRTF